MEILIIIFWFALSITVGVAAYSRGRNPVSWVIFSVIFSPLLGVLFLMAFKPIEHAPRQLQPQSPAWAKFRRQPPVSDAALRGWSAAAVVLGVIVVALVISNAAHAGEQTRFYDNRGNSIGTATRDSQGTTTFRDSRGNTAGTASTSAGQGTVFRDSRGNVTGRSGR